MPPPDALARAIRQLAGGQSLSTDDTAEAFGAIMRGEASPAQVAAILVALRVKGETIDEVAGGARALRDAMVRLSSDGPDSLVDTCGTGGGAVTTFNISTAAALVAAGAGVRIAKHGNRSFTSQCGSADVLEALGVRIECTVDEMEHALREAGIVFMFAPLMHPAMRHVGPVRRELAIHTMMNILGPLANPAGAGRQVVGVADPQRLPLLAGALAALGSRRAMVVHGEPGMDEVSPLGPTRVLEVTNGRVREWTIDPATLGLGATDARELGGADPAANARTIEGVLTGRIRGAARAAVVLNAAAAIHVSGDGEDFEGSVRRAEEAVERGEGYGALERLRSVTGRGPQAQGQGPGARGQG
ncbi:MAG TPA: anthranilate phosphoribosyltransferase [Gemmatimonadaceae bacterium]|nr:anthranilate phosphoribosyltransferase [Gemmatimonadaceae bacterium]